MAYVQINARDLIFEVSDGAPVTPTWTALGGLKEGGVNYGDNEAAEDTTVWDNDGEYSQEIMQRGATLTLKGSGLIDPDSGARDPGQAQLNEYATLTGPASQVPVRMRYPGEDNWITWTATVSRGDESAATNSKVPYEYKFTRCGAAGSVAVA